MNINTFFNQKRPVFSLEVFPPKKSSGIDGLYNTLNQLKEISPDFISVTHGAGKGEASSQTVQIATYIKHSLGIEPLAHLTCVNSDLEIMENNLKKIKENDIENILALRGDLDETKTLSPSFTHSSDLVNFIKSNYQDINVVGACYPEGHYESKSLNKDIDNLKYKIDAGVSHLITQLFFDNKKFYKFKNKVESKGISIPIEAGIMPIVTVRQIERTVALSGASLPSEFTHMISRYSNNPEALFHAGTAYAIEQIYELLEHGVQGIHLYTMNNPRVAIEVYNGIKDKLGR